MKMQSLGHEELQELGITANSGVSMQTRRVCQGKDRPLIQERGADGLGELARHVAPLFA